ncbi:MAG: hypothetical protein ROW48_17295 [Bellilinea sp.]
MAAFDPTVAILPAISNPSLGQWNESMRRFLSNQPGSSAVRDGAATQTAQVRLLQASNIKLFFINKLIKMSPM